MSCGNAKYHWHFGEQRYRVKFNIFIRDIAFKRNDYFLRNSRYTIFQANYEKLQKIRSRQNVLKIDELARLQINESIAFTSSLYQDLPSKYLEKYLPKYRRIVVRQRTKINKMEYLIRDIGYIELPLHELVLEQHSPVHYEYDLYDPDNGAEAAIRVSIEFRVMLNIPIRSTYYKRFLQCWEYLRHKKDEPVQVRHIVNQEHFEILQSKSSKLGVYSYNPNAEGHGQEMPIMSPSDLDLLSQHRQKSILKRQESEISPLRSYTLSSFQQDLVELNPNHSPSSTNDPLKRLVANNYSMETLGKNSTMKKAPYTPVIRRESSFRALTPSSPLSHNEKYSEGVLDNRPLPGTPPTSAESNSDSKQRKSVNTTDTWEMSPSPPTLPETSRQLPCRRDCKDLIESRRYSVGSALSGFDHDDQQSTHSLSYSRSNVPSYRIQSFLRTHGQHLGGISSSGSASEMDDEPSYGELRFPPSFAADVSAVQFIGEGITQNAKPIVDPVAQYFLMADIHQSSLYNAAVSPTLPNSDIADGELKSEKQIEKQDVIFSVPGNRLSTEISRPSSVSLPSTRPLSVRSTTGFQNNNGLNTEFISLPHGPNTVSTQIDKPKQTTSPSLPNKEKNLRDYGMIPVMCLLERKNSEQTVAESMTVDPPSQSKEVTPIKSATAYEDVDEFAFGVTYYDLNE